MGDTQTVDDAVVQVADIQIAERVRQYVAVRDKIAAMKEAHKAELLPFQTVLERLNGVLLDNLNQHGMQNAGTQHGTFYKIRKASVTIADMEQFRGFVLQEGAFNLVDWRASKTAAEGWLQTYNVPPPGVSLSVAYEVGVRRPAAKPED